MINNTPQTGTIPSADKLQTLLARILKQRQNPQSVNLTENIDSPTEPSNGTPGIGN